MGRRGDRMPEVVALLCHSAADAASLPESLDFLMEGVGVVLHTRLRLVEFFCLWIFEQLELFE